MDLASSTPTLHLYDDLMPTAGSQVAVQLLPKLQILMQLCSPGGASPPAPIVCFFEILTQRTWKTPTPAQSASAINLTFLTHVSDELLELHFPGRN